MADFYETIRREMLPATADNCVQARLLLGWVSAVDSDEFYKIGEKDEILMRASHIGGVAAALANSDSSRIGLDEQLAFLQTSRPF